MIAIDQHEVKIIEKLVFIVPVKVAIKFDSLEFNFVRVNEAGTGLHMLRNFLFFCFVVSIYVGNFESP